MECFYDLVMRIKKANKKYLSNFYLREEALKDAVDYGKVNYVYKNNGYLNLWLQKDSFKRLYYFIADRNHYEVEESGGVCVCDVVCKKSDPAAVCRILSEAGMEWYAAYGKWVCKAPVLSDIRLSNHLRVVDEDDGRAFTDALYLYFDELSDLLPEKDRLDEFVRSRHFIGVRTLDEGMLVAGMVYTKRGCIVTEEFIFVMPDYQGMGISKLLHNMLYRKYAGEKARYTAWIRTDNRKSIQLHSAYHYTRQDQYKVTFLRGKNCRKYFKYGRFELMEEKIMELLKNIDDDILTFEGDNLFEAGLLDSFLVIDLVSELEDAFDMEIDAKYVLEENFKTKEDITALISKLIKNV